MTWSSTLAPFSTSVFNFAEMVKEMSGGNFEIRVEGSEKHKAALGILDMTKGGQYEMGHTASYYWKGKDMSMVFFTTVPFGMNVDEQNAWFYHGGGMELMKKAYNALPPEYQAMLVTAMKATTVDMYSDNFAGSAEAWAEMKSVNPDIQVKTFPTPVL